jgi:hypothetical protein
MIPRWNSTAFQLSVSDYFYKIVFFLYQYFLSNIWEFYALKYRPFIFMIYFTEVSKIYTSFQRDIHDLQSA